MPKYPDGEFNQTVYVNDFMKEAYDRFSIIMPKGSKDKLKALAKIKHLSVNALVTEAVENYYHITLSK